MGPKKAVDYILDFDKIEYDEPKPDGFDADIMRPANAEGAARSRARRSGDEVAVARLRAQREAQRSDRQQMVQVQHWWIKRMIETPRPLEEKMTLFWHGLLATSYRTIEDSYHMYLLEHAVSPARGGELRRVALRDHPRSGDDRVPRQQRLTQGPAERQTRPAKLMELFSLGSGTTPRKDIKGKAPCAHRFYLRDDAFVFNKNNQ